MKSLNSICALVFDLDDTLVDAEKAYDIALKSIGLTNRDKAYLKARSDVKALLPKNHVSCRSKTLFLKRLLENAGSFSAAEALKIIQTYEKTLAKEYRRQFKALKRDRLFKKLAAKYKLALLTNETLRTQLIKLNALDPNRKYFDFILTSEECGVEKPLVGIFKEAQKRLKLKASQILFVGDHPLNDVHGPKQLGWKTCHTHEFPHHKDKHPAKGDIVIKKLDELIGLLT